MAGKQTTSSYGTRNCETEDGNPTFDKEPIKNNASFCEQWKDPVSRGKLLYSLSMTLNFFALGLFEGEHGATFMDLQIITNTDIKAASAFFTFASVGLLTGSIITGLVYNKINEALLTFIGTLGLGITNIFLPYSAQYQLMYLAQFFASVFVGNLITVNDSVHMSLWGTDADYLLQLMHFSFSIGGFITPLIAEPFLAEKINPNRLNETMRLTEYENNTTDHHKQWTKETRVGYVYLIVGIFIVICSFPFLVAFVKEHGKTKSIHKVEKRRFSRKGVPFPLMIIMLFGMCGFYYFYCCVENSFLSFLMTFLVTEFDSISKTKGAFTTSLAWASFAVARFLMIFMTKIMNTTQLLFLMISTMVIALSCFTIFAYLRMVVALIVFSAISALTFSGIFAVGFSWMESDMFQVTGPVSSCIHVSVALGSILNPLILGHLMKDISNMWFCYLLLAETLITFLLFLALFSFSRLYVDKKYGTLASSLNTIMELEDVGLNSSNTENNDEARAIFTK